MKKPTITVLAMTAAMAALSLMWGCNKTDEAADAADAAQETAQETEGSAQEKTDYGPLISELNLDDYITVGEYKGLSVSKNNTEPTEEDVNAAIDSALADKAEKKEITGRPVQNGDIVNIDYEGKKDGVAFDGGTAQGYDLTIGSGQFIPGFEDGLVGAEVGETRDLNLTFPENYGNEELAGADVVFTVTVNSISESVTPELTDELVKEIDSSLNNVAEYREQITEKLRSENESQEDSRIKNELLDMVVDASQYGELPQGLVNEQIDIAILQAGNYATSMGISTDDFFNQFYGITIDQFKEQYKEYAEHGAKQMLAVFAIAEKEGLLLNDSETEAALKEYMTNLSFDGDYKAFLETTDGRGSYEYIHYDKVLQYLYDNADIKE